MTHVLDHARTKARFSLPRLQDLFALARQRRALRTLDTARLTDLGLTREEALQEAQRPVWDVPCNWKF